MAAAAGLEEGAESGAERAGLSARSVVEGVSPLERISPEGSREERGLGSGCPHACGCRSVTPGRGSLGVSLRAAPSPFPLIGPGGTAGAPRAAAVVRDSAEPGSARGSGAAPSRGSSQGLPGSAEPGSAQGLRGSGGTRAARRCKTRAAPKGKPEGG